MKVLEKSLKIIIGLIIIFGGWQLLRYAAHHWEPFNNGLQTFFGWMQDDELFIASDIKVVRPFEWTIEQHSENLVELREFFSQSRIKTVGIGAVKLEDLLIDGDLSSYSLANAIYKVTIDQMKASYNPLITDKVIQSYIDYSDTHSGSVEASNGTWMDFIRREKDGDTNWRLLFQLKNQTVVYQQFFYKQKEGEPDIPYERLTELVDSVIFLKNSHLQSDSLRQG